MISIAIPVYNYHISELVLELHAQCIACAIDFEILIYDDCSLPEWKTKNRELTPLPHITYSELSQNLGRSKIRNLLAREAKHPYILFLDCDAEVPSKAYISTYIQHCYKHTVVCGGTQYASKPTAKEYRLRWHYGCKREARSADLRNMHPNTSFSTFNFLISKEVFLTIQFNESISIYGHEDTLFGFELQKQGIQINHINNPLIHKGLDKNDVFLHKTKLSILSLHQIMQNPHIDKNFASDVKILGIHKKLSRMKITYVIAVIFTFFEKPIASILSNLSPQLWLFDIYKIGYLCRLQK